MTAPGCLASLLLTGIRYLTLDNNAMAPYGTTADRTVYTFAAVDIGAADADRLVVVGTGLLDNNGANIVSGVTVGGVTATMVVENHHGTKDTYFWQANVPTGTTADIIVTASPDANGMGIGVAVLYDVNHTAYDSVANTTGTATVNAKAGGIVLGYGVTSTGEWTGLAEDFDQLVGIDGGQYHSGAHKFFDADTTAFAVTRTDGGNDDGFVLVSYQPN